MSTINYNLRSPKSKRKTPIFLIFRWNNKKIKLSTRLAIHPSDWNYKKQRVKKGRVIGKTYNDLLDYYEVILTKMILKREKSLNTISIEIIKSELFGIKIPKRKKYGLINYMEEYIKRKQRIWRPSTLNGYTNTLRKLNQFLLEKDISDDFDSIDLKFYDQFTEFLFAPPFSFSLNNVGKHIQNLKAVLNSAVSDGVCTNLKFKHKGFKKLKQQTSHIYLTLQELELLRLTKCDSERLTHARDLLLILCYTGLRYSDLYKVNEESLRYVENDNGTIKILQVLTKKTGQVVMIPCHPYVFEILSKYEFELPKYSNPKLNKYIKEVARLAGIDSMVSQTTSEGGKPIVLSEPKYKFVCTHTGRRSMITNLYLSKVDNRSIQRISGHVTETELAKYVGINDLENSLSLAKHSFFSNDD